jgi:hypothetical protein
LKRLGLDELGQASPHLARLAGHGFVDAYQGSGGVFVVYTTGSQVFVYTMRDTPTPVDVEDLGWSTQFAVPCARALAAGDIIPVDAEGVLRISEEDSDRAYDQDEGDPPLEPHALLERWFGQLPWGVTGDALDLSVRISGIWDEEKTTLTLLLGEEFAPFRSLCYRFPNGTLESVNTEAAFEGGWSVMEQLEAALCRHFPSAELFEIDGDVWSAGASRSRLEGQARAQLKFYGDVPGARVLCAAVAYHSAGSQWYRLVVMGLPP